MLTGNPAPVPALARRQAGIGTAVHEAYDAAGIHVGAIPDLAPNGLAVLDAAGLADTVRAADHALHAMVMEMGNGP